MFYKERIRILEESVNDIRKVSNRLKVIQCPKCGSQVAVRVEGDGGGGYSNWADVQGTWMWYYAGEEPQYRCLGCQSLLKRVPAESEHYEVVKPKKAKENKGGRVNG